MSRTRLDRVRASAGIAKLALQQIEDELTGEIGAQELAEVLRELHHEDHRQDGVFGSLAQLLTVAAQAAGRIEPDRDGEQVGAFDAVGRDPRGRYVSVAYTAALPALVEPTAGDDATAARWWPLADLPDLAFDHAEIVAEAVKR